MADKKYYWIKLRADFMNSDAVDFLMSQKDGSNYVVLYQMLCIMAIKTDGKLERKLNEIIIPYDVEKIQRDTKYFSVDTVRTAMTLFTNLGLIYKDENGTLTIANYENMVGSETRWAHLKRLERSNEKLDNVQHLSNTCPKIVHTEIEKEIEIEIEKDLKEKNIKKETDIFEDIPPELKKHYQEFQKVRKTKFKTKTQVNLNYKHLQNLSPDLNQQKAIIEQSIANGYQGLFAVKARANQQDVFQNVAKELAND